MDWGWVVLVGVAGVWPTATFLVGYIVGHLQARQTALDAIAQVNADLGRTGTP